MLKLSRKITISVHNIFHLNFCFPILRTGSQTSFRFENCLRLSSAEIVHNYTVLLNVSNNLTFYFHWIFSAIDKCIHSQYGNYGLHWLYAHFFTCQFLDGNFVKNIERCIQFKRLATTLANKADLHGASRWLIPIHICESRKIVNTMLLIFCCIKYIFYICYPVCVFYLCSSIVKIQKWLLVFSLLSCSMNWYFCHYYYSDHPPSLALSWRTFIYISYLCIDLSSMAKGQQQLHDTYWINPSIAYSLHMVYHHHFSCNSQGNQLCSDTKYRWGTVQTRLY